MRVRSISLSSIECRPTAASGNRTCAVDNTSAIHSCRFRWILSRWRLSSFFSSQICWMRGTLQILRLFSKTELKRGGHSQKMQGTDGLDGYPNEAADVSMLSSIVRMRDGCKVQRRYRSCSDANMHSLMLACMK